MCICLKLFKIESKLFFLAGYENGEIGLWDSETGLEVHSLQFHKEPLMCLDFDSQYKMNGISGSTDEFLEVWKVTEKFQLEKVERITLKNQGINAVKIRDDGKIAITAGWDFNIRIFSWKTLKPLAILKCHTLSIHCLACSPVLVGKRSSVFASGSKDKNIALWSIY